MLILTGGIEISDSDMFCLLNDLYDPDSNSGRAAIEKWVRGAIAGKIDSCKSRLVSQWRDRMAADPDVKTIPVDPGAFITLISKRSDYQNRAAREVSSISEG
jgi:hypothetical protein